MSLLILTFGYTHSGKTTFGHKLKLALGDATRFIHVDNDTADQFVIDNFNNLRTDKQILATRTPTNPDLRLLIPQLVTDYALKENYSVIATAAHPRRAIREAYYAIASKHGARVILLSFSVDETEALRRIREAKRSCAVLGTNPHGTATFEELYRKQRSHILEEPTDAEKQSCYRALDIGPDNVDEVLALIAGLVRGEVAGAV